MLETARGRWFLAEHMRRNRQADTKLVLKAIEQLERGLRERQSVPGAERMRLDLVDMANAIVRTKTEIAAIKPAGGSAGKIGFATNELDAIVETTEKATSEILAAIERIQEIAWTLREQGTDPAVCDILNAQATEAYTACSFQDLTGQRIRRVIDVMRFLEARIDAMIRIWRIEELGRAGGGSRAKTRSFNGPAQSGEGLGASRDRRSDRGRAQRGSWLARRSAARRKAKSPTRSPPISRWARPRSCRPHRPMPSVTRPMPSAAPLPVVSPAPIEAFRAAAPSDRNAFARRADGAFFLSKDPPAWGIGRLPVSWARG